MPTVVLLCFKHSLIVTKTSLSKHGLMRNVSLKVIHVLLLLAVLGEDNRFACLSFNSLRVVWNKLIDI